MNSTESAYVNMYYYRAENWVETSHIFCPVCFGFVTFCEERVRASIKCFWQMSTERERHFSLAMLMVVAKQIRENTPPPPSIEKQYPLPSSATKERHSVDH